MTRYKVTVQNRRTETGVEYQVHRAYVRGSLGIWRRIVLKTTVDHLPEDSRDCYDARPIYEGSRDEADRAVRRHRIVCLSRRANRQRENRERVVWESER